jgi:ribosomal protein L44E
MQQTYIDTAYGEKSYSLNCTTTSNPSTSLKRPSYASEQKITKKTKLDITSTSSNSNVPIDGYTILQNQMLFSLMSKTNCQGCGNRWNGTININKREGLFMILSFQCSSCKHAITIGE